MALYSAKKKKLAQELQRNREKDKIFAANEPLLSWVDLVLLFVCGWGEGLHMMTTIKIKSINKKTKPQLSSSLACGKVCTGA